MAKLFVAYTQLGEIGGAYCFDRGLPAYVGRRRDYGHVLDGQPRSSMIALVAGDPLERAKMRLSLSPEDA